MKEILSGIYAWSRFSEPHGYDFNGHLLLDAGGNICIDPVEAEADDLAAIKGLGIARILITNRNHSRASTRFRAETGAAVAIHPADAAHAESQGAVIDEALAVGEHIGPLTVVAAKGKSPGEVALHWPARRLLIVGDAFVGNPPGKFALLREQVMDEPRTLRQSVAQLLALDFDTVLVGDGVSILADAKARLEALVAGFPA
jgi:glyoxylase-like metal-dependent hydrolase (beta-lactamase superfamily II)